MGSESANGVLPASSAGRANSSSAGGTCGATIPVTVAWPGPGPAPAPGQGAGCAAAFAASVATATTGWPTACCATVSSVAVRWPAASGVSPLGLKRGAVSRPAPTSGVRVSAGPATAGAASVPESRGMGAPGRSWNGGVGTAPSLSAGGATTSPGAGRRCGAPLSALLFGRGTTGGGPFRGGLVRSAVGVAGNPCMGAGVRSGADCRTSGGAASVAVSRGIGAPGWSWKGGASTTGLTSDGGSTMPPGAGSGGRGASGGGLSPYASGVRARSSEAILVRSPCRAFSSVSSLSVSSPVAPGA